MRWLLVLLVVAGAAYYYQFYYRDQPAPTPPPTAVAATPAPAPAVPATTASKHGFDEVTALLRQDMEAIPTPLDGPGHSPTNAIKIKRSIGSHVSEHAEYQTLVQACDLIIQADGQRTALQEACRAEQTRTSFGGSLHSGGSMDRATSTKATPTPDPKIEQKAILTRFESNWQAQRAQEATQVGQLLASLAGKQI